MITIAEPKEHIERLWGKQRIRDRDTYRMMRYVLRVDHDDKVLLHNVVTGQLVVLEREEVEILAKLPISYAPEMEQLVIDHYLVPEDYDEHGQVIGLRMILRKFEDSRKKPITHYTILPTTACNARCYYCFEQGVKSITMTERIAENVVSFISSHHDDQKVSIQWFGGEPTVASKRIDQISEGLHQKGVSFDSTMISNGYLFDEGMVERAKKRWNLRHIQISIDGTEENYNKVKAFVNPPESPYQRVMRNVGLLLDQGIAVGLRMNYDLNNWQDFEVLLQEVTNRFQKHRLLNVYVYPIIGEYADHNGNTLHASDAWFAQKTVELNNLSREMGMCRKQYELPHMHYKNCEADDDSAITINALGNLVKCPEHFDQGQEIGNVTEGIQNMTMVDAWKSKWERAGCANCTFYPRCVKLTSCGARDACRAQDRIRQFEMAVVAKYDAWNKD